MLKFLHRIYQKERFYPSAISIFVNPYYIVRRGLTKGIISNARYMRGVMLDFGCGSKPYADVFDVEKYIGVDMPLSGHDHTDEPVDIYYDGRTLPFVDNTFDSIFAGDVLEHVFDIEGILDELGRVLKTDGKVLITIPFAWPEHEEPYDFARYTTFGIKDLLQRHDFEVMTMEKTNTYIESLFQLWNTYLFGLFYSKNFTLNVVLSAFFVSPFTMVGLVLSKILPVRRELYSSIVIVAKKR